MSSQEHPIIQINTSNLQEMEFEGVKRTVISGSQGNEMVPKRPHGYWTRERCYDEAKKYLTKSELRKNNQTVYNAARRNGWLDDYSWLKERVIWTRSTCFKEARKYKSRGEFARGNHNAYTSARKNGWLSDYTWFNILRKQWDYKTCYEEAKKYRTRSEFKRGSGSAYSLALKNDWLKDYTWILPPKTHKTQ